MRNVLRWAVVGAFALGPGLTAAEAGSKGPKTPETPFSIHVFTASTDKDAVDSTNDVRRVIEEKKRDWFRLTDNRAEADIVLEITGRDFSSDKEFVVSGRLTTANIKNAPIIGQCIMGILDLKGPWKTAAGNMAKRIETFCRETYADLAEAQKKRVQAASSATASQ
jgi:hypothetical protein